MAKLWDMIGTWLARILVGCMALIPLVFAATCVYWFCAGFILIFG